MTTILRNRYIFTVVLLLSTFLISCTSAPSTIEGTELPIVFVSSRDGNEEIYLMDANGSNPQNISNHPSKDITPNWSPEGKAIIFSSDRSGNLDLFSMTTDGGNLLQITSGPQDEHFGSWSPDSSQILFVREGGTGEERDIFIMSSNGENEKQLTDYPGSDNHPNWSPDGSKILFLSSREGNCEIFVMNADGTDQTNLSNSPQGNEFAPAWSFDGSQIAFISDRDGNREVYVMDADGSNQINVTQDPGWDFGPSWTSNSGELLFFSTRTEGEWDPDIFMLDFIEDTLTQLTFAPGVDEWPRWRPK